MFITDENPHHGVPWVNYGIFAVCILVGLYEATMAHSGAVNGFIKTYGSWPHDYVAGLSGMARAKGAFLATFDFRQPEARHSVTSMFLHSGFAHLSGNLLFLWAFGDNVEHVMGRVRYLLFYLLTGICANTAQAFFGADTLLPGIGASGAISGVMGAYLVYFPHARVNLWDFTSASYALCMPAWVFLILSFLADLALAWSTRNDGMAHIGACAHVGGLLAGVILAWPFKDPQMVFVADAKRYLRQWGPSMGARRGPPAAYDPWAGRGGGKQLDDTRTDEE